ncbi:hypothetical protein [Phascolarctobacterium succinatutens]
MSKNLIPEIAKMLGVELGEEFKVKGDDALTYRFDSDGLKLTHNSGIELAPISANVVFVDLVNGKDEIVKLPWKPKEEEHYYTFTSTYKYTKWKIGLNCWHTEPQNLAFLKAGWVFRTRQEAEVALPKAAAEFGVEYEI